MVRILNPRVSTYVGEIEQRCFIIAVVFVDRSSTGCTCYIITMSYIILDGIHALVVTEIRRPLEINSFYLPLGRVESISSTRAMLDLPKYTP